MVYIWYNQSISIVFNVSNMNCSSQSSMKFNIPVPAWKPPQPVHKISCISSIFCRVPLRNMNDAFDRMTFDSGVWNMFFREISISLRYDKSISIYSVINSRLSHAAVESDNRARWICACGSRRPSSGETSRCFPLGRTPITTPAVARG